jgi:hypothetical protein
VWAGPQDVAAEFQQIFARKVVASGAVFILDSEENHRAVWCDFGKQRGRYIKDDAAIDSLCLRDLLCNSGRKRYDDYNAAFLAGDGVGLDGTFICDLSQDVDFSPKCGSTFCTTTRSSFWFNFQTNHLFTPAEIRFAHGWPSIANHSICVEGPVFQECTRSQLRKLAGNGMHLAAMGAFIAYCLSQLRRRDELQGSPSVMTKLTSQAPDGSASQESGEEDEAKEQDEEACDEVRGELQCITSHIDPPCDVLCSE